MSEELKERVNGVAKQTPESSSEASSLLIKAVEKNDLNSLEKLLKANLIDLSSVMNQEGYTPLIIACEKGFEAIVKLLLDHGAKIDGTTADGYFTPLRMAALSGHAHLVSMLLEQGAPLWDTQSQVAEHQSALFVAAEFGRVDVVKVLLKYGANVDVVEKDVNVTALNKAAEQGQSEVMILLIESGALINREECITPLIDASFFGRISCVELLLEHGIDVDTKDGRGSTALLYATQRSHVDVINLLLKYGADPSVVNQDGETIFNSFGKFSMEFLIKDCKAHDKAWKAFLKVLLHYYPNAFNKSLPHGENENVG